MAGWVTGCTKCGAVGEVLFALRDGELVDDAGVRVNEYLCHACGADELAAERIVGLVTA